MAKKSIEQQRRSLDEDLIKTLIQRNVPEYDATWRIVIDQVKKSANRYLVFIHNCERTKHQQFNVRIGPNMNDLKVDACEMIIDETSASEP